MPTPLIAADGSLPPTITDSDLAGECDVRVDVAGEERGVCGGRDRLEPAHGRAGRSFISGFEDRTGDAAGWQFRLGYHPGVRVYVRAAPRRLRRRPPRRPPRRSTR